MPINKTESPYHFAPNVHALLQYCNKPIKSYALFLPGPSEKEWSRTSSHISASYLNWFWLFIWLIHANWDEIKWHICWYRSKQSICRFLQSFYPIILTIFIRQLLMISMHLHIACSIYTCNSSCWNRVLEVEEAFIAVWGCCELVCKKAYLCISRSSLISMWSPKNFLTSPLCSPYW